jgi:hypothetical protein
MGPVGILSGRFNFMGGTGTVGWSWVEMYLLALVYHLTSSGSHPNASHSSGKQF